MKKTFTNLFLLGAMLTFGMSTAFAEEGSSPATVKMTYVDYDNPDTAIGEIAAGQTAKAGYNKISGGSVGFVNTGWSCNWITYIQVDASAIEGNITGATLSFDVSGSTDGKRTTTWGVGYNSSAWSADMTYNSADKSITVMGGTQNSSSKASTSFNNVSFDITEALNNAEGGVATIIVYETAAAGGFIKDPTATVNWTTASTYAVTFTETNGVAATVTMNGSNVTSGTTLADGTYSYTATATGYKDYTGEFTVAGADLNVEFTMTPKETWSYTVNGVSTAGEVLGEVAKGSGFENDDVTYYYPEFFAQGTTLLSKNKNGSNPYWGATAKLNENDKVFTVTYDGTPVENVVFYKEAEYMEGFTLRDTNNAPIRCSNGLGGTVEGDMLLTTLPAGKYKIFGQVWGTTGLTAGVKMAAASEDEDDINLWVLESTGSLASSTSEEFTLNNETELYVYTTDGNHNRMLDLIYIQKTGDVALVESITLDKTTIDAAEVGEEIQLTATYAPEDAVNTEFVWTSSDEEVATVSQTGLVTIVSKGNCVITVATKDGSVKAECVIALPVATPPTVKMTYVNMDAPDEAYGEIAEGETAMAGYNKISGGTVGFGNTGWGVNYITYLQVDASGVEGHILNATLSFDVSGSTDNKRTTKWGLGYNSSVWSADMTYNTADKSITTFGDTQSSTSKAANTFNNLTFDITEALRNSENGVVTLLVYETEAAGGYIKNPVLNITSTTEALYNVTFTETAGVEATIMMDGNNVTSGTSLINGTYSYTATAAGYKDYTGEFTVEGADLNVEFTMTPKETWNYTVNAISPEGEVLGEIAKGSGFENDDVTYYYPEFFAQGTTLLSKNKNGSNPYWGATAKLNENDKVFTVTYDGTPVENVVFYKEAEVMEGFTSRNTNNAPIRCSNGLGGTADGDVVLTTLPAGKYKVFGQVWGTTGLTAGVKVKAATEEGEDTVLWSLETTGSLANSTSEEFTLTGETVLYVYTDGGTDKRMLDLVYIQKTGDVALVESITLSETNVEAIAGTEIALTFTYAPEEAVNAEFVWSSSDETVATVSQEGIVSVLAEGNCVITVATVDGSVKAECTVSVTTGVGNITVDSVDSDYYTVTGIRIAKPTKSGIYIHNGKKIIVK